LTCSCAALSILACPSRAIGKVLHRGCHATACARQVAAMQVPYVHEQTAGQLGGSSSLSGLSPGTTAAQRARRTVAQGGSSAAQGDKAARGHACRRSGSAAAVAGTEVTGWACGSSGLLVLSSARVGRGILVGNSPTSGLHSEGGEANRWAPLAP
jgi:hypothetical protein